MRLKKSVTYLSDTNTGSANINSGGLKKRNKTKTKHEQNEYKTHINTQLRNILTILSISASNNQYICITIISTCEEITHNGI